MLRLRERDLMEEEEVDVDVESKKGGWIEDLECCIN